MVEEETHVFHIFDVDSTKLIFMHEHVMNNQEHVKNIRTFKNIQTYSREFK